MRNDTLVELLWLEMQVSAMSGHILFFSVCIICGSGFAFLSWPKNVGPCHEERNFVCLS